MMRQMRQNTKIIMLVTAAAFVALMVFEWGMDMSGQSAGGDMGRVGSTSVSVQEFNTVRQNLYQQVQENQQDPITSQQERRIDDAAWDEVVNRILIELELENRGIRVTDEEIRQAALYDPLPELRNDPQFRTEDGQFDLDAYHDWLRGVSQFQPQVMQQIENYYRETLPRNKLLRQLTAGIHISDAELWREFRDRNEQADARFLTIRPDVRVSDDEVEVTDQEIRSRYDDNITDFRVPAAADIRYLYLTYEVTAADSAAVMDRVATVREELQEGIPFDELASIESDDTESAGDGGRVGTVQRESERWPQEFVEAAFSLPVGELSEPVMTSLGAHLMEVLERDGDEAEVRHILFSIDQSDEAELRLLSRADSMVSMGRNLTLEETASELRLEIMETEITEDFSVIPGVGDALEARDWIFEDREPVGSLSPVFETRHAFYMVELMGRTRAGTIPVERVQDEISDQIRAEKKLARAMEQARGLREELANGSITMAELAEREGLMVDETGPFTRMDGAPGLGQRNAAVGAAFSAQVGEFAGPIRRGGQVIILEVLDRVEADREAFEIQKNILRQSLVAQRRQDRLVQWLDGLRETTRIVDGRADFFRAVEEQEDGPPMPMAF